MWTKLLLVFFFAALSAAADVEDLESDEVEWDKFKKAFDKHYTPEQEVYRLGIFKATLKAIREHNEKYRRNEETYTQGVNQFADLTHDEFVNRYTMTKFVTKRQASETSGSSNNDVEKLESDEVEWEKFKKNFNKHYDTPADESSHFAIFKSSLNLIRTHNEKYTRKEVGYFLGVNQFADLNEEELNSSRNHFKRPSLKLTEPNDDLVGTDSNKWTTFKKKFSKQYGSSEEEQTRFKNFQSTLRRIEENNAKYAKGEVTHLEGVNQFADLSESEWANRNHGLKVDK